VLKLPRHQYAATALEGGWLISTPPVKPVSEEYPVKDKGSFPELLDFTASLIDFQIERIDTRI
jgi:hypothetical protein